jgi:hypothetical protein
VPAVRRAAAQGLVTQGGDFRPDLGRQVLKGQAQDGGGPLAHHPVVAVVVPALVTVVGSLGTCAGAVCQLLQDRPGGFFGGREELAGLAEKTASGPVQVEFDLS